MLITVSVLACSACAFVCGGILGKAYFATRNNSEFLNEEKLQALLEEQRGRYRKRMVALKNVIGKHEETRKQIRDKLVDIETKYEHRGTALKESQTQLNTLVSKNQELTQQLEKQSADQNNAATIEKEFSMLRIERDELVARLSRIETEQNDTPARAPDDDEERVAKMRAIMGELRESLATSDRRVHDLELQLNDSNQRVNILQNKLESWKQRVVPLTRQLKHQKELIRQLRNADSGTTSAETSADNLQAIQGIGPVIEKRLHQQGIRRFQQLAELSPPALADLCQHLSIPPSTPIRDGWAEQARTLNQPDENVEPA